MAKVICKKPCTVQTCMAGQYVPAKEYVANHGMPDYMLVPVTHAHHNKFCNSLMHFYAERGFLSEKQVTAAGNCWCLNPRGRSYDYPEGRNDIGEAMGGKYDSGGGDWGD